MTPEQKKLLRDALLAALVTMSPQSMPVATLQNVARQAGFRVSDVELLQHLDYLVKSGMAELKPVKLSAGVKRWESTAAAVEYCEGEGLV